MICGNILLGGNLTMGQKFDNKDKFLLLITVK